MHTQGQGHLRVEHRHQHSALSGTACARRQAQEKILCLVCLKPTQGQTTSQLLCWIRPGHWTSPNSQRGKAFPEQGCCLQEQLQSSLVPRQSYEFCLSMLVSWKYLLLAFRMTISCDPYSSLRMSCNQMSTGGDWDFCVTKISFLGERFYNWAMYSVWGFCMTCPTKWQLNATDPTPSPQKMLVDLCFILEAREYFNKSLQERTAARSSMSNTEHCFLGTSPAFNLASLIPNDNTCW